MIDLRHKSVLITGGSRGIGRATALLFAKAGAAVAITYRSHRTDARSLKREIEKGGRECVMLRVNAASEKEIRAAVKIASKRFGRIDILVNNAGIWKHAPLQRMTSKQWDETLDVNLRSAFLFTREVFPFMKRTGGKIINVSSTAGQRGEPFHSHYAASKAGMIAFTKSVAVELAPFNINVNCIAPGWVSTDMTAGVLRGRASRAAIEKIIPLGRVADPEEIAGPILFLASELASHLVGATISVNGGSVLVT